MEQLLLKWIDSWPNGHYLISGGWFPWGTSPYRFNGWFDIIMWLNSFGNEQYIVSGYNSYEWINTYNGFFMFPFKWEARRKWGKGNYDVRSRDLTKDEVLYHSPYN